MSKAKRKRLEKDAARQSSVAAENENVWQGRRLILIVSTVFVVIIGMIIALSYYFSEDQKFYRIDVIDVDDLSVGMDYFVRRCHATNTDPMTALTGITQELVLKKEAEDYDIEVSASAIDAKLKEIAQGTYETPLTQSEFNEWYRQSLNETGLTDKEYRDLVYVTILQNTFEEMVAMVTPTTGLQAHVYIIKTDDEDEAAAIRERWEAGEDFSVLADELSTDIYTNSDGGEVGWIPEGVYLNSRYDDLIFNTLEVNVVSDPTVYYDESLSSSGAADFLDYLLILVTEREADRPISDEYLSVVQANAFEEWIGQALSNHTIKYHGINNGFDSETYTWINYQLQKMTTKDQQNAE